MDMSEKVIAKQKGDLSEHTASIAEKQQKSGPPEFLIKASDAINAKAYDAAIEFLKEGIDKYPFASYSGIGDIYIQQGENKKALEWLEKAHQCNPESMAVVGSIGQALAGLNRIDEAAEILISEIKIQKNPQNIHSLVESLHKIDKGDIAIETLEEIAKSDPSRILIVLELVEPNKHGSERTRMRNI
jgi:tetratricopeptide (TPR) repeat protein